MGSIIFPPNSLVVKKRKEKQNAWRKMPVALI